MWKCCAKTRWVSDTAAVLGTLLCICWSSVNSLCILISNCYGKMAIPNESVFCSILEKS